MAEEEKKSYVILRPDGLAIHAKPVTESEAWWLWYAAYKSVEDLDLRIRYLEEWGNVLDVSDYLKRLRRLGATYAEIYGGLTDFYEGPEELRERVDKVFSDRTFRRLKRLPKARRIVEELVDEMMGFLSKPVEPRPIVAPVRYLELYHDHVVFECCSNELKDVVPRPEWYAYKDVCCREYYGISVFPDSLWLWFQSAYTYVVAVRRDVDDKEVVAALANDDIVQGFLKQYGEDFKQLVRENEADLIDRGYDDVVRKAKIALGATALLSAGRREEEALPA